MLMASTACQIQFSFYVLAPLDILSVGGGLVAQGSGDGTCFGFFFWPKFQN